MTKFERILGVLDEGAATAPEIALAVDMPRKYVNAVLSQLVRQQRVRMTGRSVDGGPNPPSMLYESPSAPLLPRGVS